MSLPTQTALDRPIWTALTTRQTHLGLGDTLARRFHPDVAPFAAVASETPDAWRALHALLQPGEQVAMLSADTVAAIDILQAKRVGTIHQMVATQRFTQSIDDSDVINLGPADVDDMLALVQRTKPGPFGKRTREMGHYIGIRERGELIAMAGERMAIDGYVEISAVCVDERCRGRGLAGRLMNILRREIGLRGETPFLHVFSHNESAIALYERLGFELRHAFALTQISHAESGNRC
ncbi:GNAT family N-acetyltransferase [Caballeronia novacaledonica]|uniref:GNAT family N-acetyltransferase n=1 Tax=Caballeronia novacaledonica TaxID=1544861 RepID=A0AA37IFF1_9BURK|nr:GNAT family N-acetyltransferase [Caballeronia novacaledonica]GJH25751.1 GNAT family N-acetyltransferase [Caballeronia novacaledonica]